MCYLRLFNRHFKNNKFHKIVFSRILKNLKILKPSLLCCDVQTDSKMFCSKVDNLFIGEVNNERSHLTLEDS